MKKGQKDGKLIVKLKRHFVSTRIIGIIHSILTTEVDLAQPYLIHIFHYYLRNGKKCAKIPPLREWI